MSINKLLFFCTVSIAILSVGCGNGNAEPLPKLGQFEVENGDTTYHTIPSFTFVDQEGQTITQSTFNNEVYIADFFFTSCPSICPQVKKQMLRIYERFQPAGELKMLSHSIDTKRDSVPVLKKYADNLGVEANTWHFVTGDKDEIFSIANEYFVTALVDPDAPGGFDHSGRIILVDKARHVRSFCDGTDPDDVDLFMKDIDQLLDEYQ